MSDPDTIEDELAERPDLEAPLEDVLAVDEGRETWTFDDIPIDSGPFGEFVGRGIVESVDDGYRLADPEAVRAALAGTDEPTSEGEPSSTPSVPAVDVPTVDRTTALLVAAAVAFVGLTRAYHVGAVYRNGDVVLSGNDPYAYRYYVEAAVQGGGAVPDGVLLGEPLFVATMATLSDLLGGVDAVGHVLAWYPVVVALVSAVVVYLLAVRMTGDRRVGVAAVLFLALLPGHALRTGVGYADHHAFDYLWLALIALAVTWLADVDREALGTPRTAALVVGLGVAVAGQVLAWDAGPLLLAPLGLIVAGRAAVDVSRDDSPLPAGLPVVLGVALGSLVAFAVHVVADFQTTVVALSPAVIAGGSAGALTIAVVTRRLGRDVRHLLAAYVSLAAIGLAVLVVVLTPLWDLFVERLDALFRSDAIAETQSLFSPDSLGFFLLFGFALLVALPAMVVGLRRSVDDGRWLVVTTYAWYCFALATIQVRFVGELGTFSAVFAGIGFVWAAVWIDAIPRDDGVRDDLAPLRVPKRRVLATLFVLLVLIGSFGGLQVGVKTSQVTTESGTYESATFIENHAEDRGLTYPENYVLSDWGDNRAYNYFVNGESSGYGYARQNYEAFATGTDPDSWYDRFDGRVGYVVLHRAEADSARQSTLWKLSQNYGSADGDVTGVGHFRALYEPPGESRIVYEVVPGAVLNGTTAANGTVTVSTSIEIGDDAVTYERRTVAGSAGNWNVRVANPGAYEVEVGETTTSVEVPAEAVYGDERVSVG